MVWPCVGSTRAGIRRTAMANSTDFNGHGLGMRNGHVKAGRIAEGRRASSVPAAKPEDKSSASKKSTRVASKAPGHGVRIDRKYTVSGANPLDTVTYERRSSAISNPDGSVVFRMDGAEVPADWSQLATDIVI